MATSHPRPIRSESWGGAGYSRPQYFLKLPRWFQCYCNKQIFHHSTSGPCPFWPLWVRCFWQGNPFHVMFLPRNMGYPRCWRAERAHWWICLTMLTFFWIRNSRKRNFRFVWLSSFRIKRNNLIMLCGQAAHCVTLLFKNFQWLPSLLSEYHSDFLRLLLSPMAQTVSSFNLSSTALV
jgi:hypothetical protein